MKLVEVFADVLLTVLTEKIVAEETSEAQKEHFAFTRVFNLVRNLQ